MKSLITRCNKVGLPVFVSPFYFLVRYYIYERKDDKIMYTTLEQYTYYKSFAEDYFNFAKNVILRYPKSIQILVDYADMVRFTFANIRRPNTIMLHIDNIVCECGNGYNKRAICSLIIIAITHELFHVEQAMIQHKYVENEFYHQWVERCIDYKVFSWLSENREVINKRYNTDLDLSYFDNRNTRCDQYASVSTEEYYKYIFLNVVFRKEEPYRNFVSSVLDKYQNIAIFFNDGSNFLIKNNGGFCDSCLNDFIHVVGSMAGRYDRYTVSVNVVEGTYRDKVGVAMVTFTLSNRQIYPMDFRQM